ncbi:MAG: Smr/MutS family protein [Acidobacteria bacterium]|nr:Smr/MutS family protein [Acidobacteriota bacterium]MBI3655988.1 Smr/MutS family protein [Acidobacteriota bacterium]
MRKNQNSNNTDKASPLPRDEEPVAIPIEDWIDLHSFAPGDIPAVVEEYLNECYRRGLCNLRIIHGRGIGVQRAMVRAILERTPTVISYSTAPAEAGGWGATLVTLKSNPLPEKD